MKVKIRSYLLCIVQSMCKEMKKGRKVKQAADTFVWNGKKQKKSHKTNNVTAVQKVSVAQVSNSVVGNYRQRNEKSSPGYLLVTG